MKNIITKFKSSIINYLLKEKDNFNIGLNNFNK